MPSGFSTRHTPSRVAPGSPKVRGAAGKARCCGATILCAILTFFVATPLPAQLKTASQQELDVIKVLLTQERDWNKGDIDAYARGYKKSPETIFIGRQISKGYDQMLFDYHHNYPTAASMGTLGFSELEAHPLDENVTVVIGKYHLDRSKKEGGNADGTFSLVLEKTDQGWKIVLDHTT